MSERRGRLAWPPRPGSVERRVLIIAPFLIIAVLLANSYAYFGRVIAGKDWSGTGLRLPLAIAAGASYDALAVTVNSLRATFDHAPLLQTSSLPSVHLRVEPGSLERMTADLPASAKARYYDAELLYPDGQWRNVEYRLRGQGAWHWHRDKPSLRVKLRKSAPLDWQRHLNFVNPEDRPMVANLIDERLAREMGLLTHQTTFARLFINGQYRGVYHRTTHKDESLLRLRRRLPGPIYEANRLRQRWRAKDFRVRAPGDLPAGFEPLQLMTNAMYLPAGPDRHEALWRVLSFDAYARYLAFMSLVSATHADFFHNHLFYFDPAAGRLEPWITDSNGHGMLLMANGSDRWTQSRMADAQVPLNELMTPLLDVVLRDPRLRHQRNIHLFRALQGKGSVDNRRKLLNGIFQDIDADVRADRHKGALERDALEPYRLIYANAQYKDAKRQLYGWIERREAFLRGQLNDAAVRVWLGAPGSDGRIDLTVEVSGQSSVDFDAAKLGGILTDRDLDGHAETPAAGPLLLHPGLTEAVETVRKSLRVFHRFPNHRLLPGAERYLLSGQGITADALAGVFTNAVTGVQITPEVRTGSVPALSANVSIHPWRFAAEPDGDVILGPGDVILRETMEIGAGQHLTVRAGTRLRLGPGVSILSKAPVTIDGTAAQPVIIERADPAGAWGILAIQGPAAKGSRISSAHISGGSLAHLGNVSYSGMVSVHHTADFELRRSTLSGNVGSDEALHIVNSDFSISESVVTNCYADCIDLDYADGVISGLSVDGADDDGVDFMTSVVELDGVIVRGAGDKGLSIGEASQVTARGLRIEDSKTAVAVKDASRASLTDATLAGSVTAVHIFAKNWRYGGPGWLTAEQVRFSGNQVNLRTEDPDRAEFIGQTPPVLETGP